MNRRLDHPGVARLSEFGDTIFATMSKLATEHDAVNLGQGFPDASGPPRMLEIAREEIAAGNNQYAPGRGMPVLLDAISVQRRRDYGLDYDPDTEILVTVGATEGIAATVLGLVEPGEEVIVFEPYYDAYAAAIALAGARRVAVPLVADGDTWAIDADAFEAAATERTALVIINNPHNPTGSVLDLGEFARVCREHDLTVLSDEAYEYLVYDGRTHVPVASLEGMRERTVTVASAAKSFNVTGWKTGWAMAPAPLIDAVTAAKQYLSYVGVTPVQPAVAHGLLHEREWVRGMVDSLQVRRDLLSGLLVDAGLTVHPSAGTYFLIADTGTPDTDGVTWCTDLIAEKGVAAIPVEVFADDKAAWRSKVRFTFCKSEENIREAGRRLSGRPARG